jgi:transcriptional regulator with XRE-family HTH domain
VVKTAAPVGVEADPAIDRLGPAIPQGAFDDGFLEHVGAEIRRLRKQRGLTLEEMVERSAVSLGALSQLERGSGNPELGTLARVAHALGVSAASLLTSTPEQSPVVRRNERRRLTMHPQWGNDPVEEVYELLTPGLKHQLEVLWLEVPPGSSTQKTPYTHGGEEVGVVLEGVQEVHVGDEFYVLQAGDAITYPSTVPHWYHNPGPQTTRAIWIITPPTW